MNPFLAHLHAYLRRTRLTREGAAGQPGDVQHFSYKSYRRMPQVPLPQPESLTYPLAAALASRVSATSGNVDEQISLREFGTLFGLSLRERADKRRNYPSAGALYPVETYLISTAIEGQAPGVFHYEPAAHALERLLDLPPRFDMKKIAARPDMLPLSALLVFTGVWNRSSVKYGDLAYLHTLLESGHMSQNVLLTATALELQARPYAGFNDRLITELLDINEEEEQAIHSVTLSKRGRDSSPHEHFNE